MTESVWIDMWQSVALAEILQPGGQDTGRLNGLFENNTLLWQRV